MGTPPLAATQEGPTQVRWEYIEHFFVPAGVVCGVSLLVAFLVLHPRLSDLLFTTLYAKTFAILGYQLLLTYLSCILVVNYARRLHSMNSPTVASAARGESVDLKLVPVTRGLILGLFVLQAVLFLLVLFVGIDHPRIGVPLIGLWSMGTGSLLGLVLLAHDERAGSAALAITTLLTVGCGVVGIFSKISFAPLGRILFIGLLLLLLAQVIRLFTRMNTDSRVVALFGSLVFVGYLLFDFQRLSHLDKAGENSWSSALSLALDIYLDVINLFLYILDLLSKAK